MKLVVAVVQDEDADHLVNEIVAAGYRVTRVSSTGSLLRTGNTSLIVGADEADVPSVIAIIRTTCKRRTQIAVPYSPALEPGLLYLSENFEVEVGGAIIFVLSVERYERL
jgi:uncharacterized protein YaaQ